MGLFGGSKKTYVSSVVYNLAGPEEDRVDYLKTTVVSAVLSERPSIADAIVNGFLDGPAMDLRSFARWARTSDYTDELGLVSSSLSLGNDIDIAVVAAQITSPAGTVIEMQSAFISSANYEYFGDQYVAENYPLEISTPYTVDYADLTNLITITFVDTSVENFTPTDFVKTSKYLYAVYSIRMVSPPTPEEEWVGTKVFIYRKDTGNAALDAMFGTDITADNGFIPYIPFRIDNEFVSVLWPDTLYPLAKKGFKKSIRGAYDDIQETIEDNEDLGDIDYAYAVFGVSLNVKETACKKYIYKLFEQMMAASSGGSGEYDSWEANWNAANDSWLAWKAWYEAGSVGTEPIRIPYPPMPFNELNIKSSNNTKMNYDITIEWNYIIENVGSGLFAPDAKVGELRFVIGSSNEFNELVWIQDSDGAWHLGTNTGDVSDSISLLWQVTDNTWKSLNIQGLKYINRIYGGKAVEITGIEALEDVEESGFIVPMHEDIYKSMGLKDSTQMATACCFMVFNCYQIVKQKWYQTGLFKVVIFIVIIVVSIYTGGSTSGLLGTSASVGASLGYTGVVAIIVGAIANAVAAMVLISIIQRGAVALFGDKLGSIIGAIAGFIAVAYGSSLSADEVFSFSTLLSADNIMGLMSAVGSGYQGYMTGEAKDKLQEAQQVYEDYEKRLKEIQALYSENIGNTGVDIAAINITNAIGSFNESSQSFLDRTLMTGSDVAALSLDLLREFTQVTTSTDLPLL